MEQNQSHPPIENLTGNIQLFHLYLNYLPGFIQISASRNYVRKTITYFYYNRFSIKMRSDNKRYFGPI